MIRTFMRTLKELSRAAPTKVHDLRLSIRLKLGALQNKALPILLPLTERSDTIRIGSDSCGWNVPGALIDSSWICYSAGVGTDITFDLELIERFGCKVYALDPTPKAVKFMKQAETHPNLHFLPVGLWSHSGMVEFYAPRSRQHVSYSIKNLQRTSSYISCPCETLEQVLARLGHTQLDLLKLDIEGAEFDVLDSILDGTCMPRVLLVEFDQPASFRRIRGTTRRLCRLGYMLTSLENWNFTFVLGVATKHAAPVPLA